MAEFSAGTDAAGLVLYDPAARSALSGPDDLPDQEAIAQAAEAGELLYWYTAADGHFRLRVYVEEPAPAALVSRAQHGTSQRLLRLPSGRLCLSGIEELGVASGRLAEKLLPTGDYRVDAFEVAWTKDDLVAERLALRAEAGFWAVLFGQVLRGATLLLGVITFLALCAVLGLSNHEGRAGLARALAVGPWLALAWGAVLLLGRSPLLHRLADIRQRLAAQRPDAAVILHRIPPGDALPTRGALIGAGYGDGPDTAGLSERSAHGKVCP